MILQGRKDISVHSINRSKEGGPEHMNTGWRNSKSEGKFMMQFLESHFQLTFGNAAIALREHVLVILQKEISRIHLCN